MTDLNSRDDIYQVVSSFYERVKKNELLGNIFTKAIPEEEWEQHMQKITDFWDSAVFGTMTYSGNPPMKHVSLDRSNDYKISKIHFDTWLKNWDSNIDSQFKGDVANNMKIRAVKMATGLFLGIWNSKPEEFKK